MQPLITPQTAVSPPGAGTCTATPGAGGPLPGWETIGDSSYRHYTYTATPTRGYRFVRFDIDYTTTTQDTQSGRADTSTSTTRVVNPYNTLDEVNAGAAVEQTPGVPWTIDYERTPVGEAINLETWISALTVTAVFELLPPHAPTHLLVNSSNRANPVRLVYDPESNLLVADF